MTSIVRIIVGLALMIGVAVVYSKNTAQIAAGGQVRIFGISAGNSGWLIPAFIIVGLVGMIFVIVGIAGILKNRK